MNMERRPSHRGVSLIATRQVAPDASVVPKEQVKIARRFIARVTFDQVPEKRLNRPRSTVPSELNPSLLFPALKRRAIRKCPDGTIHNNH
jgi:hypothetical protein